MLQLRGVWGNLPLCKNNNSQKQRGPALTDGERKAAHDQLFPEIARVPAPVFITLPAPVIEPECVVKSIIAEPGGADFAFCAGTREHAVCLTLSVVKEQSPSASLVRLEKELFPLYLS